MRQVVVLVSWAVLGLCAGQKPCCTPDQWEGTIQGLQGFLVDDKLGTVDGTVQISYDFTNQKLALVENLNETGTGNIMVKVIQDYKMGKQYVIRGKSCMESALKGFVKQCIPDNATNIGSFSFGGLAPGGLECDAFMTTFAGMDNNYVISDVTRNGCYPVTQVTVNLMREHSTVTTQIFTDITTGIKDPSVFTPPEPPCAKNYQVVFEDTSVFGSDFLERALRAFKQVV
ncbi:mammalian ependymin-related protein 1-like [Branchiostoma floridae x Branchiostoma belcheri]